MKSIGRLPVETQKQRAEANGISERTQKKLDYLAVYREDLLHEVQMGAMSVDAAYKRATGKVAETAFEKLKRAWGQLTEDEKRRFPHEVVTDEVNREMLAQQLAMIREEAMP
jgi:hypothetical protein